MNGVNGADHSERIDQNLQPLFSDIENEEVTSSDNELAILPVNDSDIQPKTTRSVASITINPDTRAAAHKSVQQANRLVIEKKHQEHNETYDSFTEQLRNIDLDEYSNSTSVGDIDDSSDAENVTSDDSVQETGEINAHSELKELESTMSIEKKSNWIAKTAKFLGKGLLVLAKEIYRIAIPLLAFGGGFVAMAVVILTWPVSLPVVAIAMTAIYLATAGAQYKYLSNVIAKQEQERLEHFGTSYNPTLANSSSFEEFAENEKIKKHLDKKNDGSKGEAAIFHYSPYIKGKARDSLLKMSNDLEELKRLEKQKRDLEVQPNQTALMSADNELEEVERNLTQVRDHLEKDFNDFKANYSSFDKVMDKEKLESLQYKPSKTLSFLAAVASSVSEAAKAGFAKLEKLVA